MSIPLKKQISIFLFLAFISTTIPFSFGFAQQLKYPPIPGVTTPHPGISLEEFARYIYRFSLIAGGIIAVSVFIYGGFLYLISAGNPVRMNEAKERITSAVLGLLILFGSYLILTTIDPHLVIFLQQPQLPPGPSLPKAQPVTIPPQLPKSCFKIDTFKSDTEELIDFLFQRNIYALILEGALIGGGGLYQNFQDINKISQFTCEEAKTYCCPECLTPHPVTCVWGEEEPLPQWLQDIIKAAENALSEFAEKNIKELVESAKVKKLQGTLNKIKDCHLDFSKTLYINGQAKKKEILDGLNLGPGNPLDFYCCVY